MSQAPECEVCERSHVYTEEECEQRQELHDVSRYLVPFPGYVLAECSCGWSHRLGGQDPDALAEAIAEHIDAA